jgi:hypothetical protein
LSDVQGSFTAGSFDDIPDTRLVDTRSGLRPPDGARTVITGRPGATGVVSLVMSQTSAAGYVQVLGCNEQPGAAYNLNADSPNQIRAGLAFVRFDQSGQACVYSERAAHVVADLQGYMVHDRFDDIVDQRVLDTRSGPLLADEAVTPISGRPNSTAVVSLIATNTAEAGFVQVLACGATPGTSSNLNVDRRGQIVATLAFVRFDSSGRACLYNKTPTHLDDIVDLRVLDTRNLAR